MKRLLAILISSAIPTLSWADVSNTATATYNDAAGKSYTATSNTVTVTVTPKVSPPVITSSLNDTGDVGAAFSYQIQATNSPTSFSATGLPVGLAINTVSGLISGTPTSAGVTSVVIHATNSGGTGNATMTVTIRAPATVTLQKSANTTSAISGDTVTFTIQYQNTSNGNATNVVIADVVPSGSTLVSGSITAGGTLNGSSITWSLGTVGPSGTGSVSFQVKVN